MEQSTRPNSTPAARKGKHLNYTERQQIGRSLRDGVPIREIAKHLDRDRTTILRERRRGLVTHVDTELKKHEVYSCERAQGDANINKTAHGPDLKIGNNVELAKQLAELLTGGGEEGLKCSPYAAKKILERRGVEVPFSERTIYNYIHNNVLGVTAAQLVQGARKKRRKSVTKRLAHTSTDIKSIEERPEEINKREEVGHFEMDCVVGTQETVDLVAMWINCYPRKIFNGRRAWDMAKGFRAYFRPRSG